MAAIPTLEQEDARRPNRERETLVGERTRIVNRMKSTLARLGIGNFKPNLRKAPERLGALRTPQGVAAAGQYPGRAAPRHGASAAGQGTDPRDRADAADASRPAARAAPRMRPHAMLVLLARVIGVGIETADMLVHEMFVAQSARPPSRGALCRSDRLAGRERRPTAREGAGQGRQCPGAPRHDPVGVALSDVPEGQRTGAMVPAGAPPIAARGTRKTMIVALARKLLVALWRLVTTGEVPQGVVLRAAA